MQQDRSRQTGHSQSWPDHSHLHRRHCRNRPRRIHRHLQSHLHLHLFGRDCRCWGNCRRHRLSRHHPSQLKYQDYRGHWDPYHKHPRCNHHQSRFGLDWHHLSNYHRHFQNHLHHYHNHQHNCFAIAGGKIR